MEGWSLSLLEGAMLIEKLQKSTFLKEQLTQKEKQIHSC